MTPYLIATAAITVAIIWALVVIAVCAVIISARPRPIPPALEQDLVDDEFDRITADWSGR
ncbi:hypothetical protein [Thermomonospora umbrina]|uniref:Uncharacterized protein n=1 Tax=Thermomonospora umbrina TaxID=111806 RepID=A0A3D9T916_9ACTN|nr:hypothetical protein [Thermomonospora umbrina]REF00252.1 hypothetical protein DFJ69_5780 [Thermomonospora umbrina]